MSAEIATSPASFGRLLDFDPTEVDGNESTSVALFFPRNWLFSERTAALDVTSTFTGPLRPAARRARNTKRSSVSALSPAIFFCRITNSFSPPSRSFEGKIKCGTKANRRAESRPSRSMVTAYPLASAAVALSMFAAAAACFSALAASACLGSASKSIC